jgi:hypothetical protein
MAVVIFTYKTVSGADSRVKSLHRRGIKSAKVVKGSLGYKVVVSKTDFMDKYRR